MAATIASGPRVWGMTRDREGQRTYNVTHQVRCSLQTDGPAIVMNTPGLPWIGSQWNFGSGEFDLWAYCYPDMEITQEFEEEGPCLYFNVTQKFGTRPMKKCQDETVEDPLMEPQKISGTFVTSKKPRWYNFDGTLIKNSSHERIPVDFDDGLPTVRVEQNVATLGLSTFAGMIHNVNSVPMWGLAARCVKLSNITWRRNVNGMCDFYYTRIFDFEVNPDTFDLTIPDRGTMALGDYDSDGGDPDATPARAPSATYGEWVVAGDEENPLDFNRFKDKTGEPAHCYLNGHGVPVDDIDDAESITVQGYSESNLFLLGVPATF